MDLIATRCFQVQAFELYIQSHIQCILYATFLCLMAIQVHRRRLRLNYLVAFFSLFIAVASTAHLLYHAQTLAE